MWIFIITLIIGLLVILFARKFQNNHSLSTFASEKASFAENVLYTFEIVGEQSYQHNLKKIAGPKARRAKLYEVTARVVSEPSNSFDAHAIRVEIQGLTVGYLKRQDARQLSGHSIDKKVPAVINGGWLDADHEGSYGVKLAIRHLDDLR
ncbi:hypothetical protein [Acinetobacter sp. A47]|uniref:hypothetical protein n=1 Tax=Acinetobacter sp. A47 TaxID=1561217 RepID=UPI00056F4FF1|nr:hypothetical protein [Acinetobacter sp. A47]